MRSGVVYNTFRSLGGMGHLAMARRSTLRNNMLGVQCVTRCTALDVVLDHRRVDAQLLPILETKFNGRVDGRLIDGLQGRGSEAVDGAVERVVFGHPLAVELGEMAQRVPIRNAFA